MADRFWKPGNGTWDATVGLKWSATDGGVGGASVPTAADDVFFNATSAGATITQSGARVCRSLDCTGFTGTFAGSGGLTIGTTSENSGLYILKAPSAMTWSNTGTITLANATASPSELEIAMTEIPAGAIVINGMGVQGLYKLTTGNLQSSGAVTIGSGFNGATLDCNGYGIIGTIITFGFGTNVYLKSGTHLWLGTGAATIWNCNNGGFTAIYGGTSVVGGFLTTSSAQTFGGGNQRETSSNGRGYNHVTFAINGSTGTMTIADSNSFNRLVFRDTTNARSLSFTAGTTNSINWRDIVGTSGKKMSVLTSSAGSQATLVSTRPWRIGTNSSLTSGNSANVVVAPSEDMDYVDFKDINGVGTYMQTSSGVG
jgi:hypothetical protein